LHLITIKDTHTTFDTAPLDEGSACLRKFYVATHNTNNRQTSMPSAGFETSIPACEQPPDLRL